MTQSKRTSRKTGRASVARRDGTDVTPLPTSVIPGASAQRLPDRPRSIYRAPDGQVTRDLSVSEIAAAYAVVQGGDGLLWVDVDSTSEVERDVLPNVFTLHPLSIEDALSAKSRVKLEEFEPDGPHGYLLLVLRAVRFCIDTPDDPYDIETVNLSLFVGKHFVVTVHREPSPSVDAVAELVHHNPDLLARGASRLAHMVADNAIDAYFPILDEVDGFIDQLEERVFTVFDQSALQDIFRVKRLVLSLRRYLTPQRDVFNSLSNRPSKFLPVETQVYFRDVYDHVLRINDALDTYRELLSGTLDGYLTQVNNRLGQVTKGLSVVATLSIPFVVISGMWGMNVDQIPFAHVPHAFEVMLVLQLALGGALVWLLKSRDWL